MPDMDVERSIIQRMFRVAALGALAALCLAVASSSLPVAQPLTLHARTRTAHAGGQVTSVEERIALQPERTALIICDMWDDHWCKGAALRVVELAGPMNQ